ncbi:hypothetical protein EDD16DRAFT_1526963 [Pisolithus croceorrhizus]|nr:hypothetical protein EDD16DRAFT_1526963 [Pisolithus croceorrhizus]KAI6107861.1 hypothetical protein EV401DRAFT_1891903 [Pisolithus croceorrhizus]KAI6139610.1 hypothetical protein EDD17DRAFT_1516600 [Pisolithus thermaeus]
MVGGNRVPVSVPPHRARDISAKSRRSNLERVEALKLPAKVGRDGSLGSDDSYEITPPDATYSPDSDSYPEPNDNWQNADNVQTDMDHWPIPKLALRGGFKEPILARGRDTWWICARLHPRQVIDLPKNESDTPGSRWVEVD